VRRAVAERRLAAALALVALGLLGHLAYGVFHHGIDFDEIQFLHEGWLIANGQRQYVDFWDDHGPLLPAVCSVFYRLGGSGDAPALFANRSLIFAALLASAALVAAIARRLRPGDPVFAGLALALFAASPILGHKGLEVRSDNFLQLFSALALLLWLRAAGARSVPGFALAGLALGAGFLATQKTVLVGVAFAAAFAVRAALQRRLAWREIAAFGAAALVLPAALVLWQWREGSLDAFVSAYALEPFRPRVPRAAGLLTLRREAPLAAALALGATLVAIASAARRRVPIPIAAVFAIGATLVLLFLGGIPHHFSHTLLPVVVPIAIATAWALETLVLGGGTPTAARGAILLAAVCAIGAFEVSVRRYPTPLLGQQLAAGERIAFWVPQDAILFDGGRLPIERRRALRAPSLVLQVQRQILTGRFPVDVGAELERRDVAWWSLDGRARAIERRWAEYRRENFLPVEGTLVAAGKALPRDAGGGATFEIRVAAAYWWRTASGAALRMDGAPAPNPVFLADGPHRAEWEGSGGLVLSVVPLDRWPVALHRTLGVPPTRSAHRRSGEL
jgi:4-amino-4-deoxy-L-arabinose transferase-like glycosyltransferase